MFHGNNDDRTSRSLHFKLCEYMHGSVDTVTTNYSDLFTQELMSGEAMKEHETLVPSKS